MKSEKSGQIIWKNFRKHSMVVDLNIRKN